MSKYWLFLPLAALYLTSLGRTGFVGPDEPRYASIGREMAHSGDWITPRLDGSPWFEKPPLLYWMTGWGHRLHLSDEWAARLPVAIVSLLFLLFFYNTLAREFSGRIAFTALAILATCAGWASLSFAGITDLPMSAALGATLLIAMFGPSALPGHARQPGVQGSVAGVLLGIAILGKGFEPVVLIAPAFLIARRMRTAIVISSVAIAAPWYVLMTLRHGSAFWNDFFWKQHVDRFLHPTIIGHEQPFWFYAPVLLAGLFPWTPLIGMLVRRKTYEDPRVRFLILWLAFGIVFLSATRNKLPTYILPLLPALAIVLAVALEKVRSSGWWLGSCVLMLVGAPLIAQMLPDTLLAGLSRTRIHFGIGWPFVLAAAFVFFLAWRGWREWAVASAAFAAMAGIAYLKTITLPAIDQRVSARSFWQANRDHIDTACFQNVRRDWTYQLNYYAGHALPACRDNTSWQITGDDKLILLPPR